MERITVLVISGMGLGFYSSAFYCAISLETISFSADLVTLEAQAFDGSGLWAAVLPKGITDLSYSVFNEAKWLGAVSLPRELQNMSYKVFGKCQSLKFAVLPDRVKMIDSGEFSDCSLLEQVGCSGRLHQALSSVCRRALERPIRLLNSGRIMQTISWR